jgi:zinc transporter 1/2/3
MPAHVFALFLILTLSTIGMLDLVRVALSDNNAACGFPLVSRRASRSSSANTFVFYSQHFGTGVLIATAFVHLLPTAFMSLLDPCLPQIWNKGYKPMAGVIAMTSALIVVGIEMFLRMRGAGHSHSHGESWDSVPTGDEDGHHDRSNGTTHPIRLHQKKYRHVKPGVKLLSREPSLGDLEESEGLVGGASPLPESVLQNHTDREFNGKYDDRESDLDLEELAPAIDSDPEIQETAIPAKLSPHEEQKRLLIQCLLLEAGILFHSVFIGMAVSVATGPPFVIFLIAIAFHQSFEGLALGSRIAAINFPKSSPRPWLMVLAYGTTTPIGQAIGLLVHRMYDPHSETGLLMVGIMNAISSGLLLFAGLVQLLAEDFLSDKSYSILKGKRRRHAFVSVIAGAALMALVGAWA